MAQQRWHSLLVVVRVGQWGTHVQARSWFIPKQERWGFLEIRSEQDQDFCHR